MTASGGAAGNAAGSAGTAGGSGSGGAGGAVSDAATDADARVPDVFGPPADARRDGGNDASESGSTSNDGGDTSPPPDDASVDASTDPPVGMDVDDAGSPPTDGPTDVAPPIDAAADTGVRDAGIDARDVVDSGPTGPQILPKRGTPIENPDAGGPFDSRCASDEVVTGFIGRAGVQTDAIASTCSKLIAGSLSSPRNLPLNGNLTGGSPFTVTCPANHVAVSIVGRYGHNTMWNEDITTAIGVVCKNLTSSATQTVAITGQPALDSGYTTFREDCTGGRYLTDLSGRIDGNSLGITVGQVGGECDFR